jgi:predicted Zn-dependent protease
MNYVAASVLIGLPVLPLYAQEPSSKGVNFYSLQREIEIGQEVAASLARTLPVVHDPKLDGWLAGLTAELSKYADPRFAYSFTVYDDRKPLTLPGVAMAMPADAFQGHATEPVALPGGPILVPLSLLAKTPGEAAFAFQLAHAMAHVSLRHGTKQATRLEIQRIATVPLMQNPSGPAAKAILWSEPYAMPIFARRFELEADSLASGILAEAGYDPEAVIPYLEGHNLEGQPPAGTVRVSRLFSAHPTVERRVETIRAKMETLPARVYRAQTGEFEAIQALVANIH